MKATLAAVIILTAPAFDEPELPHFTTVADWQPNRDTETALVKAYALGHLDTHHASCLDKLWHQESRWRYWADNPTSTAYGIPQILGLDPALTPYQQIDKGMSYIASRYDNNPCDAWRHWQRKGWY